MRKSFLLTLFTIALLGILGYGMLSTGAWFTDTDSTSTAALQMGKLNPYVNAPAFTITGAAPGVAAGTQTVSISNQPWTGSNIALKYKITAAYESGNGDLYNNLWVKAELQVSETEWVSKYEGWLKDLVTNPVNMTANENTNDSYHVWRFTYTPADSLGNSFQNVTTRFHLVFTSTQIENPGWNQ